MYYHTILIIPKKYLSRQPRDQSISQVYKRRHLIKYMEEISTAVAEFDSVELFPSAFDFGLTPSGIDDGVFTQGDGELQEEETLDAILTRAREDSVYVFPYSRMMTLLKCSGWNRWVFPKSVSSFISLHISSNH